MLAVQELQKTVFTLVLIVLRCVVPLLVYMFDTYIWYTITASTFSIFTATRSRIGRVSTWSQLVRTMEASVALFNSKLVNLGEDAAPATPGPSRSRGLPGLVNRVLTQARAAT